ncbi:MAG TPA: M48 family metalloprotease [Bryobacteraceae bacterium]|nr:M48 family metalloprotease [Bryobacteraceae bacterium]
MKTDKLRSAGCLLLAAALIAARPLGAQTNPAPNFDAAMDRAFENERSLITKLQDRQPVIETYIQEMRKDKELGFVPKNDFYFLGGLNLKKGIVDRSFIPRSRVKQIPHIFSSLVTTQYYPRGFADEMYLDVSNFDRSHYHFEYVRREFLGEVRCFVVDVQPNPNEKRRRFTGRLWIEDRDYNIVRFNGTYDAAGGHEFGHFDSWRVNTGGLWLPSFIYSQDEGARLGPLASAPFRAQTRIWNYERAKEKADEAFTNMTVEMAGVKDESDTAAENSPVQSYRMWEEQAAGNVVDRLLRAGLVSPTGEVDQVLNTVLNNLAVTNNVSVDPPIRARVLLTTPLESVAVNHTILISRGLIDVLPDEACLAGVLAHEMAHVVLGHSMDTKYAFEDRLLFDDPDALKGVRIQRTQEEEKAADDKALELLKNSPYKDQLTKIGLFLRMLSTRSDDVPHLIRPLLGNKMSDTHKDLRLSGLMESAPELKIGDKEQISALPLGARVKMDPWSNQLHLIKTPSVSLVSAKEKLPFQITPFILHLTREDKDASGAKGGTVTMDSASPAGAPKP